MQREASAAVNSSPRDRTRVQLIALYNSTLAGRHASAALAQGLGQRWLPSLQAWLGDDGLAGERGMVARRVLVRLGWLLGALPQAASIHGGLLDRAIREFRAEWRDVAAQLFKDVAAAQREIELLDAELLDCLQVTAAAHSYCPPVPREPLRRLPVPAHPHDREVAPAWQHVLSGSRARRREQSEQVDAMARVAGLRAGDRVMMVLEGGRRETWRVVRREDARDNILLESEETNRQGVLGLQTIATQLAQGRLAILT